MAQLTSNNVAKALIKLVAADTLPALLGHLTVGNLVSRYFEPVVAQAGDVVPVPGSPIHIHLQHAEATFRVPDVTKVLAVPDLLRLYAEPALMALAETMDTEILALHKEVPGLGQTGQPVTIDLLNEADTLFAQSKLPHNSTKYLVVSPSVYNDLRRLPTFSEYNSASEAGLRVLIDGVVGRLGQWFIFRSALVPTAKLVNLIRTYNLAFSTAAIGLPMRRLPQPWPSSGAIAEYAELGNFGMRVVMHYQPNTLAQEFTVDVLYGVGVIRPEFILEVRS